MSYTAQVTLAGEPASAGRARRFLCDNLTRWGVPGLEDDARVVITELVTNAVLHARTPLDVSVHLTAGRLRIEVRDGSTRKPLRRKRSATATTGRGLGLIGELSDAWGVLGGKGGKVVWAELTERQLAGRVGGRIK